MKKEFGNFENLMSKVEKNVTTVQNTLSEVGVRTRAINRTLRDVSELPAPETSVIAAFEDLASVAPLLAAASEEA